jgi:ribosomal protein L37AE/L43A
MPIDTRPVNTSVTATDTTDACPYCRTSDRIRQTSDTDRVQAWSCDHCGTDWAYSLPDTRAAVLPTTDLGAVAQEIGRLRWIVRQLCALVDDAPTITNAELRDRLLALAVRCPRPGVQCAPSGYSHCRDS